MCALLANTHARDVRGGPGNGIWPQLPTICTLHRRLAVRLRESHDTVLCLSPPQIALEFFFLFLEDNCLLYIFTAEDGQMFCRIQVLEKKHTRSLSVIILQTIKACCSQSCTISFFICSLHGEVTPNSGDLEIQTTQKQKTNNFNINKYIIN